MNANRDILSDVLRSVRLRGALYFHVTAGKSWVAEAPPARDIAEAVMPGSDHVMEYHVVTRGACWSAVLGQPPVRLEVGDVVLFPHGDAHVMSSAPGMRAPPPDVTEFFQLPRERRPFALHYDAEASQGAAPVDDASENALVCGFLACDLHPFNPLIATLPRQLHLRAEGGQDWIAQFIQQVIGESRTRKHGGDAMLERMSEMMFIDAVRRYVDTMPEESRGWLAGLRDRHVGRALTLMHENPATAWTVDELGKRAGLSRSALHERFQEMIGQPPMQYLANWRMQVGAALLRNTNATVASVAQDVGYESEAAFTRAFKRVVGKTPSAWRQSA